MRKPIEAWLDKETGLYRLYGDTYPKRDVLKSLRARWVSEGRYWLVSKEAAEAVKALFIFRARIAAYCHMPEETIVVNQLEIDSGFVRRGCLMCDTSYICGNNVEILEAFGPAEV